MARSGMARHGKDRGEAGQGEAMRGMARHGKDRGMELLTL